MCEPCAGAFMEVKGNRKVAHPLETDRHVCERPAGCGPPSRDKLGRERNSEPHQAHRLSLSRGQQQRNQRTGKSWTPCGRYAALSCL